MSEPIDKMSCKSQSVNQLAFEHRCIVSVACGLQLLIIEQDSVFTQRLSLLL